MLIFDLETNGLLREVHTIWCMTIYDSTDYLYTRYDGRDAVAEGLRRLSAADCIAGHNIIAFDIPVIKKLYPRWEFKGQVIDTMVWARLAYPDIKKVDFALHKQGILPGKLIGRHSLKAWGYRLRELKGDYAELNDWSKWTPELSAYCEQDVRVTARLVEKLSSRGMTPEAIKLEHEVQKIIARQIDYGVAFAVPAAERFYASLLEKQRNLNLTDLFPPWYVSKGTFTPKKNNSKAGYAKGCPFTKIEYTEFNPGSRQHIISRFKSKYGWEPEADDYTDKGNAEMNEEILKDLPYPEAIRLSEYLTLVKIAGMVGEGDKAWLKLVTKAGRIHGYVDSNGAVTGRMTHSNPNLAQTPKVGSLFGADCRALFIAGLGKLLVGADASGLELRCLAHYLARYDGGAYARAVVEGNQEDGTDVHSLTCKALGLEPKKTYTFGGKTFAGRDFAKTFCYAFLYGAGDEKLGSILGAGARRGKQLREQFYEAFPALEQLKKDIETVVKKQKHLKGLDGRHLTVRSMHSALNTLLQSAGALVMKKASCILDADLQKDYRAGKEYEFVLHIHDEVELEVDEALAEDVGKRAVEAMRLAGEYFKFRCAISGAWKAGKNWALTH
jgi:hypothetical protein